MPFAVREEFCTPRLAARRFSVKAPERRLHGRVHPGPCLLGDDCGELELARLARGLGDALALTHLEGARIKGVMALIWAFRAFAHEHVD